MITGELTAAAASITPFIVLVPVTLHAGMAKALAFANAKISLTSVPVITPGAKSLRISLMWMSVLRRLFATTRNLRGPRSPAR